MSQFEHIAETYWQWRGRRIRVATDGLGPYYWPGSTDEPETWETMVFGGPQGIDGMMWRYLSRVSAVAGHEQAVKATKAYLRRVDRAVRLLGVLNISLIPNLPPFRATHDALERGMDLILREGIYDPGAIPAEDAEYTPQEVSR